MTSSKLNAALVGGVACALLVTVLSLIPALVSNQLIETITGCITCLASVSCGLIAVWYYTDSNELTIRGGEGAGIGAISGVVSGLLSGILAMVLRAIGILPSAEEVIETAISRGADPEAMGFVQSITETMMGPLGILIGTVITVIMGVIGGAIGAAIWKRGANDKEFAQ